MFLEQRKDEGMVRLKMFSRLLLAACLVLLFVAGAAAQDYDIAPGSRIGKIEIGMSRQAVHSTLGNPTGAYRMRARGYRGEYWISSSDNTLRVIYDVAGRVYQVSVTSPRFTTPEGLTTQSSMDDIKQHYRNLKVLRFAARGDIDYYDAVRQGIAFEFTQRYDAHSMQAMRLYAILIHKPGSSVLPEPDERVRD
jgi:hypothetical protein